MTTSTPGDRRRTPIGRSREDQYANQRKDLIYGLSRNGLLSSTVGNEKTAALKGQYDNNRIQLADQALAEATKARAPVNNTKMDLQNQLRRATRAPLPRTRWLRPR